MLSASSSWMNVGTPTQTLESINDDLYRRIKSAVLGPVAFRLLALNTAYW